MAPKVPKSAQKKATTTNDIHAHKRSGDASQKRSNNGSSPAGSVNTTKSLRLVDTEESIDEPINASYASLRPIKVDTSDAMSDSYDSTTGTAAPSPGLSTGASTGLSTPAIGDGSQMTDGGDVQRRTYQQNSHMIGIATTSMASPPTIASANSNPIPATIPGTSRQPFKYPKRRRDDDFDRTDFSKPLPINQKLFCLYPQTGKYHGAIVVDRKKFDENGNVVPDPELEEFLKKRSRNNRKKNNKRNADKDKNQDKDKDGKDKDSKDKEGDERDHVGEENGTLAVEPANVVYYDPELVHTPPPEWTEDHHYLYYIHYVEWDRRMDEWVTRDRLRLIEFVSDDEISPPVIPPHETDSSEPLPLFSKDPLSRISTRDSRLVRWEKILDATHEAHQGGHGSFSAEDVAAHEEATKTKNVATIELGKFSLDTWYYSPFPAEYTVFSKLYFCEFCLGFFGHESELERHSKRCVLRHPPGMEIYRSQERNVEVAVFEVDGAKEGLYCENLCYISKLFLDHKTLEFDCTPFLFYILCEVDERGYHVVGYFSKEKVSVARYNLACILTLPCHQRKGYGKFLISLSYELSKIEKKVGSPEKPISDLGKVSYVSYWSSTLLSLLAGEGTPSSSTPPDEYSLEELSQLTCVEVVDIEETLKSMQILVFYRDSWVLSKSMIQKLIAQRNEAKRQRELRPKDPNAIFVAQCRPQLLHWTPFFSRPADAQAALDSGMGGGGYGVGRSNRKEVRDIDKD